MSGKVVRKGQRVYLRTNENDKRVEAIGNEDAKIAIVGEAPGRDEVRKGKPFVGKSGRLLNQLLKTVGIDRYDCYITNVVKVRPPKNDIKYFYNGNSPSYELDQYREEVKEELRGVNPNVVIALGQEALRTLVGDDKAKISDWRGSIIDTEFGKVIPTYHPAYVLRLWKYKSIVAFDLNRAEKESHTRECNLPERNIDINPSKNDVRELVKRSKEQEVISFDIETKVANGKWFIDHVGIGLTPDYAMSIPFWKNGQHYWSLEDEIDVWQMIGEILGDPNIKKVGQNGQYDITFLEDIGIPIVNYYFDTMVACKLIYPEFSKGLAFIASIYTREPYYKDTSDEERSIYNGKDCCVTLEAVDGLIPDLEELEMKDFYFDHIHPLIRIYIDIQKMGVNIDDEKRDNVSDAVEEDIDDLREQLKELTGKEINVYSVKDMRSYIYGDLGLPEKYNDNGNLDTCKTVLKDFYRNTGREEFNIMLKLRASRSQSSTYLKSETGTDLKDDGRMRTMYDVSGTETGRLSSKKTVYGRGMNLQNVQHGVYREMFIPDEGMKFIGADLSQAENRVVAYVSRDEKMISVVESEGDIHTNNAAMIFDKDPKDITYEERQLGKRITHGCLLPSTEVLTPEGWVEFRNLKEGMKTAQYNQDNGVIEFVTPKILKYDYKGKMYHAKAGGHDTIYSPTHRVPRVTQRKFQSGSRKIDWKTAEELSTSPDGVKQGMMPTSGYYQPDERMNIDYDLLQLVAMTQADGSITKYGAIRFSFKKEHKKQRALKLLDKANVKYNIIKGRKDYLRLYIEVGEAKPIIDLIGKDKEFGDWIYKLDFGRLVVLIEEIKHWDGSIRETKQSESWFYFTTSKNNAEKIQTVAHLCGYTASLCEIKNNTHENSYGDKSNSQILYRVNIMDKSFVGLRGEHWSEEDYEGSIYCLKVPEEAFLIRSNGKIHVTLNSNYQMGAITLARYAGVSTREGRRHLKKYKQTYPKVDWWHKEIEKKIRMDRTLTNPFGRRRVFYDRMGGDLFRDATAFIPQSSVADAIHRATRNIHARLPHPARIVLQLHDALTVQAPKNILEKCKNIMVEELERPFKIDDVEIVIPTDPEIGDNWEEVS